MGIYGNNMFQIHSRFKDNSNPQGRGSLSHPYSHTTPIWYGSSGHFKGVQHPWGSLEKSRADPCRSALSENGTAVVLATKKRVEALALNQSQTLETNICIPRYHLWLCFRKCRGDKSETSKNKPSFKATPRFCTQGT